MALDSARLPCTSRIKTTWNEALPTHSVGSQSRLLLFTLAVRAGNGCKVREGNCIAHMHSAQTSAYDAETTDPSDHIAQVRNMPPVPLQLLNKCRHFSNSSVRSVSCRPYVTHSSSASHHYIRMLLLGL